MARAPKPGELDALGRDILRALRCQSLLITRGPDGMFRDAAGERIALICRHLRQPAVCLGRRGVPVGEVHPQVHGDLNL